MTPRRAPATRSLVLCFIGDGYLFGASDKIPACYARYWLLLPGLDGHAFALHKAHNVPAELAETLCAVGTSGQSHRDGYDAAQDAAPYTENEPFWTEEATTGEDGE